MLVTVRMFLIGFEELGWSTFSARDDRPGPSQALSLTLAEMLFGKSEGLGYVQWLRVGLLVGPLEKQIPANSNSKESGLFPCSFLPKCLGLLVFKDENDGAIKNIWSIALKLWLFNSMLTYPMQWWAEGPMTGSSWPMAYVENKLNWFASPFLFCLSALFDWFDCFKSEIGGY